MKFKKVIGLLVGATVAAVMSVSAFAGEFNLGEFTGENNATQRGWFTNGVDGVETNLPYEIFAAATELRLEFESSPAGGMQFIWQGDGDSWAWDQTNGIIPDEGQESTTLNINLSKMDRWKKVPDGTQGKIYLGYYSDSWDDLKIKSAILVYDDSKVTATETTTTDTAAAAPAGENPKTGDNGMLVFGGLFAVIAMGFAAAFTMKKAR